LKIHYIIKNQCIKVKKKKIIFLYIFGFGLSEFIYPANWVGDQTLLYRAAKKREMERSLDPPPLNERRRSNINEPVVAFGPPGSTGELNVSVIVSSVAPEFS